MTLRREFPAAVQMDIIRRATAEGKTCCECCGLWLKSRDHWQIDHVIAEGLRPAADKARRLTAADGQLLCLACHAEKTPGDQGDIARAKRREAGASGAGKKREKEGKPPLRVAAGEPALMRRGFKPAGSE